MGCGRRSPCSARATRRVADERQPDAPGQRLAERDPAADEAVPGQANGTNPVVLAAPADAKLSDKQYSDAVAATVASLKKDHDVSSAISPLSKAGKSFLSKDGRIGYISTTSSSSCRRRRVIHGSWTSATHLPNSTA
jgi:hypothetical protein